MAKSSNILDTIENLNVASLNHTDGESVFFVPELFDSLVKQHGVLLEHFIALPCPQSDHNINNVRSNHQDHDCEDGFYYTCGGKFLGIMTNNPKNNRFAAEGLIDSATCWIIVPRSYEFNNQKIYFSPYDKIYVADDKFKEVLVPNWESMESSTTGVDRLRFPICQLIRVIDKNGQPSYQQDADFKITKDGNLQWVSQNRPQFDPTLKEGGVYSVRYLYRPYWYIATVEHEIRLSRFLNPATDEKEVVRLPQYLRCVRERYFRDKNQNDQVDNSKEVYVPSSGSNLPWR